jgi:hypothetical protein
MASHLINPADTDTETPKTLVFSSTFVMTDCLIFQNMYSGIQTYSFLFFKISFRELRVDTAVRERNKDNFLYQMNVKVVTTLNTNL